MIRKVFLTSFLLCGFYRTLAAYLKTKGYNRTNKRYKLDFLGDGQKPILFCFGTWQITHILLYMWHGYICPRDWLFALTIGTIFEIIEYILGNLESSVGIKTEKYWTTGNNSLNTKDIIANSVGFIIGSSISLLSKI